LLLNDVNGRESLIKKAINGRNNWADPDTGKGSLCLNDQYFRVCAFVHG
jgi:hypothetical protein